MKNLLETVVARVNRWDIVLLSVLAGFFVRMDSWAESAGADQAGAAADGTALARKLVWVHDLQAGIQSAKKGNKLVLVDLYTDWCGWCKRLDRDTYTDASVLEVLNSQFVCVKLDAEDGQQGEAFAKQHKVRGYPCIIVLDSSGKLRATSYGYRNPADFLDMIKGYASSASADN
jgi:thiol:disulfide interchange protein